MNHATPTAMTLQATAQLLDQRAKQLEQEVATAQAREDDGAHDVTDRKDQADSCQRAEIGSAEVERDLAELREIKLALRRITDGSYGRCAECSQAIDPRRLLAQPSATRCVVCQGEAERLSTLAQR